MKTLLSSIIFIFFSLSFLINSQAQIQYTAYDKLAGIHKSYKPTYHDEMPSWAKMLYTYPINFNEIGEAFDAYMFEHPGEKTAAIRYYKIWSRAVGPYVTAEGDIEIPPSETINSMIKANPRTQGLQDGDLHSAANWSFLGPKETYWLNESGSPTNPASCPWQVNVYSFDVANSNTDILYCGTETGFVNKSTDKGLNWDLSAPDYFFGGGVTAIAIHPTNENIVYAAAGQQIHKTTDGGISWTPMLEAGGLFPADRIRINPYDADHIAAAGNSGVYISDNGGQTWTRGLSLASYDVEFKADNASSIYAISKLNGNFALYASADGGNSFIQQLDFPSNISDASGALLATTIDNPDLLLSIMLSANNTPLLYKGNHVGISWQWSLLATGQTSNFPMNNGQGYFDLVLEISPDDENLIFCGTTTLYKSSNGGAQFTAIGGYSGSFSIHPDIQDMKLLSNGDTWVSTDGGFSITSDNFSSTSNYEARNKGLVGSDMWGFDQGWNEDIVVGGRYHNGNTAIADFYQPKALRMGGAESPTGWVVHGKSNHVAFNDLGNGWILPDSAEGQPQGRFIFSKYPNMDEYGGRRGNIATHPNYFSTLYLGEGESIWKSSDAGESYEMLWDFNNKVRYIQISYANPNILFADILNKGLYKSIDGGYNWIAMPSLTNGQAGTAYWKGKTFFALSPLDEDVIYACLQNGTWSADIGKVFKSVDGGETWEDWTGSLESYTKCLVIQPDSDGSDLVYLFTNARNGLPAKVYYRSMGMDDWAVFDDHYPAGFYVNLALPFFRDGKIRVAGNAGIWESPLQVADHRILINPWLEKAYVNCMTDTIQFEDHSIMNHEGAIWNWEINPVPEYLEDANMRNPKVVLGAEGTYSVQLSINHGDSTYTKLLTDAITASSCPSIEDCDNPAEIPKSDWELVYVDSEEVNYPGYATMAFDDDPSTIWHTRWSTGSDPYPHEIQVDMGRPYRLFDFILMNRQDGQNGRIKEYELYISEDGLDWGDPISTGEFENTAAPQKVIFDEPLIGRYFRLVGLSEVNGNAWSSAAEMSLRGCTDITFDIVSQLDSKVKAFPVPTNGLLNISMPPSQHYNYQILNLDGKQLNSGNIEAKDGLSSLDLTAFKSGVYIIQLTNETGIKYHIKIVKH